MTIINEKNKKTESYNFRTTPKIMEDLKNYSKATNTTIPSIINQTLKEKFKNKTLARGQDINFPVPVYALCGNQEIINKINEKDKKENYVNHNGIWYEFVDNVLFNNCLDVWKDDTYQSNNPEMKHEGLAFIKVGKGKLNENRSFDLIIYAKIEQYIDDSVFAYAIDDKRALYLAKKSENNELIDIIDSNRLYFSDIAEEMDDIQKIMTLMRTTRKELENRNQKLNSENRKLILENQRLKTELKKSRK